MKANNLITINGRVYDTKTGELVKKHEPAKSQVVGTVHQHQPKQATKPKFVDGIQAPVNGARKTPAVVRAKTHSSVRSTESQKKQSQPAKKPLHHPQVTRRPSPQATIRPKHSMTLNRKAVSAPVITAKSSTPKIQEPQAKPTIVKKSQDERLARAQKITRSTAIKRFNNTERSNLIDTTSTEATHEDTPETPLTRHLAITHPASPKTVAHDPKSKKEELIQAKLHEVDHKKPHQAHHTHGRKKHKYLLHYGSTALVVLLLTGYVAYLNIPGISMKVAAHRAGFAATLPSYKPAGYSLRNPIAYSPGQVTISFHSNTDDRHFSLRQQPTNWDSEALKENFVAKQTENYQTFQDRGLTIYIYNGTDAAWVNNGKLYNIQSDNSQLDTNQILGVATSV